MSHVAFRMTAAALLAGAVLAPVGSAQAKHKPFGFPSVAGVTASALPTSRPPAQVPYGSFCSTPLGRVGPVPIAPLGVPCMGGSSQGPIAGQIVQ